MKRKDKRYYLGDFSKGCKKCARGAKMVLLVTGLCPRKCFYCPLSEQKMGKDVVYANEARVQTDTQIIQEARDMKALGTGVTGGEPMLVPQRTIRLIKLLKKQFGPNHHIHLYTTGEFDPGLIKDLSRAGLDEIRFHPPPEDWEHDDPAFLPVFKRALRTKMSVGIELPAIPGHKREIISMGNRYFALGMDFLNLNELEASETNWKQLKERGYEFVSDSSYAIKGSRSTALGVLRALDKLGYNVNFCTSSYKDAVQLRKRLLRRAKNIGRQYQLITDDATFYYGIVEAEGVDDNQFRIIMKEILKEFQVPRSLYRFTTDRLELAPWVLKELFKEIPFPSFLVETYPSVDGLEVERTPVGWSEKTL